MSAEALAADGERRRWGGALALVLAVHAVPGVVAAYWLGPVLLSPASEPAILVDMQPAAAPPEPPPVPPPEPRMPEPISPVVQEMPSIPAAAPVPHEPAARPANDAIIEAATPPAPVLPPAPVASGQPGWQGTLLAHLDQFKRYPREAQLRRRQGVPWIRFVMDRQGNVLSSSLERSSGVSTLDAEAVALPRRAQPLPRPPDDVPGQSIELIVPVEFFLR